MGREIVYCGSCGRVLHEEDFVRGRAHVAENRPYCVTCRPLPAAAPACRPPERKPGSSAKFPKVQPAPGTRRAGARPASRVWMLAAAAAGLVGVVGIAVSSGSGRRAAPAPAAADPPSPAPVRPRPPDEADSERKRVQDQGRRVDQALADARRLRGADPNFERSDEILSLLRASLPMAGARRPEIEREIAGYEKARLESVARRRTGPFEIDPQGYVRNWLVLGPFPNREDKGLTTDFLRGEAAHEPAEGREVAREDGTKARWQTWAVRAPKVGVFEIPHLGLKPRQTELVVYAACRVDLEAALEGEIRVGSDDGYRLWVDGREIGGKHIHRGCLPDQERYPVSLARGAHLVLLKVDQGDGDHAFMLRLVSRAGGRPAGIKVWN